MAIQIDLATPQPTHTILLWYNLKIDMLICAYSISGDIELLKFLLAKGVDIDSQSDAGTPLIWASGHAQQDAVKVLLEHHANVSLSKLLFLVRISF